MRMNMYQLDNLPKHLRVAYLSLTDEEMPIFNRLTIDDQYEFLEQRFQELDAERQWEQQYGQNNGEC